MNEAERIAEQITAVLEREKPERGLISVFLDFGVVKVHVTQDYFDKHFEGACVEVAEHGRENDIYSWQTPSGAKVFCLKTAKWERVA